MRGYDDSIITTNLDYKKKKIKKKQEEKRIKNGI